MKLLRESLANISSLPDMNQVVIFILFHFFYCKGFTSGRFPIAKFNYHFGFSKVKTIKKIFIYIFKPSFLYFILFFFCKNPQHPIPPPFAFHNFFFQAAYVGLSLFSENILDWNVWIISCLNSDGEKKFINVSSLKTVVNFLM